VGKWRKYRVGRFALGQLNGQAVVRYRDEGGVKRRRILGATSEAEARAQLDRFVRRRQVVVNAEGLGPTVGDLFAAYVKDREQDGKLVAAFHDNWKALRASFADLAPDAVNADVCRSYAKLRVSQGRSQGTIWTELTRLRSCLNWAVKRRVIPSAGYVWIPSKPKVVAKELTEQQVLRLLDACVMPHVRLFVVLAFATGGRTTAILELTWDRVDFDSGTIDLHLAERPNPLSKASRKGRAKVPMNNLARAALLEARALSITDHVVEWNENPVASIRTGFMAACRRAGLSGVTPHALRHTAASLAFDADQPIELIARFLGHRDVNTTARIYARPSTGKLQGVADAVDLAAVRAKRVRNDQ
jgi:integrase